MDIRFKPQGKPCIRILNFQCKKSKILKSSGSVLEKGSKDSKSS